MKNAQAIGEFCNFSFMLFLLSICLGWIVSDRVDSDHSVVHAVVVAVDGVSRDLDVVNYRIVLLDSAVQLPVDLPLGFWSLLGSVATRVVVVYVVSAEVGEEELESLDFHVVGPC